MNLITAAHLNLSERCLSLVNQIKNSSKDPNNNMAVPIAVLLCPLNAMDVYFMFVDAQCNYV